MPSDKANILRVSQKTQSRRNLRLAKKAIEQKLILDILDAILKLQSGTKYKKVIEKDIYDESNGVSSNLRPFIKKYIECLQAYDDAVGV
jgi:hypothetical protein